MGPLCISSWLHDSNWIDLWLVAYAQIFFSLLSYSPHLFFFETQEKLGKKSTRFLILGLSQVSKGDIFCGCVNFVNRKVAFKSTFHQESPFCPTFSSSFPLKKLNRKEFSFLKKIICFQHKKWHFPHTKTFFVMDSVFHVLFWISYIKVIRNRSKIRLWSN